MLSENLLEILRCPESNAKLVLFKDYLISTDPNSRRSYPIIDGTPILLIEKSQILDIEVWKKIVSSYSD
uniref:Uncharacterized protein n=1 Tax=Ignavibacterium album TaxID=591197 RepID=A0A832DGK1_9BACT